MDGSSARSRDRAVIACQNCCGFMPSVFLTWVLNE